MADAIARGATNLVIGLGGSATNDAGVGMAAALGWKFLDEQEPAHRSLPRGVPSHTPYRPAHTPLSCSVTGLCDVKNPLLGELGATRVFGPQKGATPEMLTSLEESLAHLAHLCREHWGATSATRRAQARRAVWDSACWLFARGLLNPAFKLWRA